MPMPNSKTNLIFHYRHSDIDVRLVVMNKKIEVYSITESGSEPFHGYITRALRHVDDCQNPDVCYHFDESFVILALEHIASEIKSRPISKSSFEWLEALQYQGLLPP
jgi:hypothetical protein